MGPLTEATPGTAASGRSDHASTRRIAPRTWSPSPTASPRGRISSTSRPWPSAVTVNGTLNSAHRQSGKRGAAVGPPPGARILVDVNLLAGLDLKDQAVRAPENGLDRPVFCPGLAAIPGILASQAKRGCVAVVAEHRLVASDHTVASHGARVTQAVPHIDDVGNRRPRKQVRAGPNAECPRELLMPENDQVRGDDHDQKRSQNREAPGAAMRASGPARCRLRIPGPGAPGTAIGSPRGLIRRAARPRASNSADTTRTEPRASQKQTSASVCHQRQPEARLSRASPRTTGPT